MKQREILIGATAFIVCIGVGFLATKVLTGNGNTEESVLSVTEPMAKGTNEITGDDLKKGTEMSGTENADDAQKLTVDEKKAENADEAKTIVTPSNIVEQKQKPNQEEPKVQKMTASEFQALLLNDGDNSLLGGKNPKVARAVKISFKGLKDDDRRPNDILAVREKISFGIWTTARVLNVGYDSQGKVNAVTIQPVYE